MGYIRFWRRIKIFPGIFLNIGKKGISFSFGPKGIKYTKGTSGERVSVGLPGTGIYYVDQKRRSQKKEKIEPADQTLEDLKKEIEGK
jgi:hypothetical protein